MQEITLAEALCGTNFSIKHLDGRHLKVICPPGDVIKPDSWKCIQGEGMPEHGRPYEHGNLYVHFQVEFPESLSSDQVTALQSVLGTAKAENGDMPMDTEDQEEVCLATCLCLPTCICQQ